MPNSLTGKDLPLPAIGFYEDAPTNSSNEIDIYVTPDKYFTTKFERKSFKSCSLTPAVDDSEGELIHFLEPSQPCQFGLAQLKAVQQQLQQTLEDDPFRDITLTDFEDAAPMPTLLEDSDAEIKVD